jgi:hypothetical protein
MDIRWDDSIQEKKGFEEMNYVESDFNNSLQKMATIYF